MYKMHFRVIIFTNTVYIFFLVFVLSLMMAPLGPKHVGMVGGGGDGDDNNTRKMTVGAFFLNGMK